MKNMKKLLIISLVHLITPFVYFLFIASFESLFNSISFIVFLIISIIVSAISYYHIVNNNVWFSYFIIIPIYIIVIIIALLVPIFLRIPLITSGNQAEGLLLIFLFGYSVITLPIGNLLGILVKKYIIKDK